MSYQKFALRLAFVVTLLLSASAWVFTQDQQDPSSKPRNVKPELKKAYKDWLDKDVTYIITDEERKAFKKLATDDERERFIEEFWRPSCSRRATGARPAASSRCWPWWDRASACSAPAGPSIRPSGTGR